MPVAGGAHHVGGSTALVARATKRVVQFRFHQFLDKPAHPIPDDHLDRVKPSRAKQRRGLHRRVSAILLHGVISIGGVSPPSLARCTSRRLHHPKFPPPLRQHQPHPLASAVESLASTSR